jgi:glycosyltransferase involved in cell wall biosynthesis
MLKNVTAVIFTKDEAKRLPLIIENLSSFANIIVFDGGSEDGTREICKNSGIKFVKRPKELRDIVGGDFQFALNYVDTEYVLIVNCSHYYPKKLLESFRQVALNSSHSAVYHDVVIYSFGGVVHRPFFRRRSSATNFYRVSAVNFANSILHNEAPVEVEECDRLVLPSVDGYSIHLFRDYDVKKTELNHSFYSDQDSMHRYRNGTRTNIWLIFFLPLKCFLHQYIRCGSVSFGVRGFIYSVLFALLEFSIQLKIWEMQTDTFLHTTAEYNFSKRKSMYKRDFIEDE